MPHKEAVVILKTFRAEEAIGTLAKADALIVNNDQGVTMLNAFLMKKVKATCWIDDMDASDMLIVGMARGKATVANIKSAMELNQLDRGKKDQANVRDILHETLRLIWLPVPIATARGRQMVEIEVSLGGGKGIPFDEEEGWTWFVWNAGANDQVGGAFFFMEATYWGAWLGS